MDEPLNYLLVEFVLHFYYSHRPNGVDSFTIASQSGMPENKNIRIFNFLLQNKLIEKVENDNSKYIITPIGIKAINTECGIENYLKALKNQISAL